MELREDILYFWFSLVNFSIEKKNAALKKYSIFEIYDMLGKSEQAKDYFGEKNTIDLVKYKHPSILERKMDDMRKKGVGFVSIKDERFSQLLSQDEVAPPIGLYYRGDVSLLKNVGVAIVGTRRCSDYGKKVAQKLAAELSEYNITVTSGMAMGIDQYAHSGALEAGGKTIAVLASGVDIPTPACNTSLYNSICKGGLVVSEYPVGFEAQRYTFIQRNRIVSGLSHKCVIVEAPLKSGSLITAERALEQNRDVFVVPASILSPKSEGSNLLLKNREVQVLTSVKDILADFNVNHTVISQKKTLPALDIFEQTIYNLLKSSENYQLDIDRLSELSGFTIVETLNILFSIEMKNLINRGPNKIIELAREYI